MNISIYRNGYFFISCFISAVICYYFFGNLGVVFGVITALNTKVIYDSGNGTNFISVWFLSMMIVIGLFIGWKLKISLFFYSYLIITSFFYYLLYGKNSHIDSTMPFFIIFSCLGTSLPSFSHDLFFSYTVGVTVSIICIYIINRKQKAKTHNQLHIFSNINYHGVENIIIRSLLYSFFLFMTLIITNYFSLYRAYWAPLTFAILLRPEEISIVKITIYRFLGSLLGSLFIISVFNIFGLSNFYVYLIFLSIVIFMLPTFLEFNYTAKTFAMTIFVLLLLEETEYIKDPNYLLPYSRIYETLIGGVMATIASIVLRLYRKQ